MATRKNDRPNTGADRRPRQTVGDASGGTSAAGSRNASSAPGAPGGTAPSRGASTTAGGGGAGAGTGPGGRPATGTVGRGNRGGFEGAGGTGGDRSASNARSASGATSAPTGATRDAPPAQGRAAGSANAGETSERSDRERNLETSREGATEASQRPRQATDRPQRGYSSPNFAYGVSGNPFAMMRRMMTDMDRLFSDFGITQPGLLASSFFGPDAWSGADEMEPTSAAVRGGRSPASSGGSRQALQRAAGSAVSGRGSTFWAPQVEVFERGNALVVRADLPGLSREDVTVDVEDDALVIRGERRNEFTDEHEGFYRSERSYGTFYRVIPLPPDVDPTACNATFRDGVLEISLPRPEQRPTPSRRLEIR